MKAVEKRAINSVIDALITFVTMDQTRPIPRDLAVVTQTGDSVNLEDILTSLAWLRQKDQGKALAAFKTKRAPNGKNSKKAAKKAK